MGSPSKEFVEHLLFALENDLDNWTFRVVNGDEGVTHKNGIIIRLYHNSVTVLEPVRVSLTYWENRKVLRAIESAKRRQLSAMLIKTNMPAAMKVVRAG